MNRADRNKTSLGMPFEGLLITPVGDGPFFIDALFQRKFGHDAPDFGHPVICFYRNNPEHYIPVCFTAFIPHEEVILVGGAMTDGRAFAHMPGELSAAIRDSGGVYYHLLRFAFDHFADDCEAFFGYAGDERAYEVDIRAGFRPTGHQHLIANFHKPVTEERRRELIEKIHALGPF